MKKQKREEKTRVKNRFGPASSQKNWIQKEKWLQELPESKHYRKQLEPLLGARVNIYARFFLLKEDCVDGRPCVRILLKDAEITKCPVGRGVSPPIHIEHIWTVVDLEWVNRNIFSQSYFVKIRGLIYLYEKHGKKNIGLQTFSLRPVENLSCI